MQSGQYATVKALLTELCCAMQAKSYLTHSSLAQLHLSKVLTVAPHPKTLLGFWDVWQLPAP